MSGSNPSATDIDIRLSARSKPCCCATTASKPQRSRAPRTSPSTRCTSRGFLSIGVRPMHPRHCPRRGRARRPLVVGGGRTRECGLHLRTGVSCRPEPETMPLSRLDRLEAESIFIFREVVATCDNPVLLYSIGKDSSVLLHLARKAFYPGPAAVPAAARRHDVEIPRDDRVPRRVAREPGTQLIVHINEDGAARRHQPVRLWLAPAHRRDEDAGAASRRSTNTSSTLLSAARGATRRNRAPRSASSRCALPEHRWDPRNQRPEPWTAVQHRSKAPGESFRVFPLSNWTEGDVWDYIARERIDVVPLYFAAPRPVVRRDGMLIMRDDDRMQLAPGREGRDALGPLPQSRLLSADRRGRERGRDTRRDHRRDARRASLRAQRPRRSTMTAPARWSRRSWKGISDECRARSRTARPRPPRAVARRGAAAARAHLRLGR